jgi:hypothetical protein
MAFVKVPKGKELVIYEGKKRVLDDPAWADRIAPNVKMYINEDVSINVSSTFSSLYSGGGSKAVNVLGALTSRISGGNVKFSSQFKQFGFQVWEKSEPISLSFKLTFYMGMAGLYSGRTEVVGPMYKLASLCLPLTGGTAGTLVPPGPSLLELLDGDAGQLSGGKEISIYIGNLLKIKNAIIEKAEPTFSKEVDSQGFPISGELQLEVKSLFVATVEDLAVLPITFNPSSEEV